MIYHIYTTGLDTDTSFHRIQQYIYIQNRFIKTMTILDLPNKIIAVIVDLAAQNSPPRAPDLISQEDSWAPRRLTAPRAPIDTLTLASLCLVSKRFRTYASAWLYSHIAIDDFASPLLDTLGDPRIAGLVRTLSLHDYRPIVMGSHFQANWTEKELEGWAKLERAIAHMANVERLGYVNTDLTRSLTSDNAVPPSSILQSSDGS